MPFGGVESRLKSRPVVVVVLFLVLRAISIIIAVDGGGGGLTIGLINFNRLIQFYINFSYMRNQFRIYPLTELESETHRDTTQIQILIKARHYANIQENFNADLLSSP